MARSEINKIVEMEIFAKVVEHGNFTAAATICNMTPSAISKLVARLEKRLNVRLVNRSTRQFSLTSEGDAYYQNVIRILSDIEEIEMATGNQEKPCGHIVISTSASYATHILSPILSEFIRQYPHITIEIIQTDEILDIISHKVDVAIRAGPLKDSTLVARKLGETGKSIVAAPEYIKKHGMPQNVQDLHKHIILGFNYKRSVKGWPFKNGNEMIMFPAIPHIKANVGEAIRMMTVNGNGLSRMANFTVREDINSGRLIKILDNLNPNDLEEFHAIHVGHGGHLPLRVRKFLDFLAINGRITGTTHNN